MPRGYDRPLYILPFDHRGLVPDQAVRLEAAAELSRPPKSLRVICVGFRSAIDAGVPRGKAGILVDEQFGAAILRW